MNQSKLSAIIIFLFLIVECCESRKEIKTGEGFISVTGGKIWYKVVGDGDKTPIFLLHGGPGYPSYYLNPLLELSKERPVIMFDQLGCGRSDKISDTTLMTVDANVEQLKELVAALGVTEFYLFGHSWGTMLGIDYYLKYPQGIKGLILASPCISARMWQDDADTLISTLPDTIELVLRNSIKEVSQDSAKLAAAVNYFWNSFVIRKPPTPDFDSTVLNLGLNVYQYMWGNNEFYATGNLKNYDRTKDLSKVSVPTLYTTGEFDEARPSTVRYYQSLTHHSKLSIIGRAGHLTMHDNPVDNLKVINDFLNEIEKD